LEYAYFYGLVHSDTDFSTLLILFRLGLTSDKDKDLEILILRQQLGILQRQMDKPIKPNRAEKLTLAVLSANLRKQTNRPIKQFLSLIRIFQPETVFGWHRQLVKRKWTHARKGKVGRPPTKENVKELVIRLTLENNWGYGKIKGELTKLGTRRVYLAGITEHPNGHWVTQQARNTVWLLKQRDTEFVGLIRDNDSKYTEAFDTVFTSVDINIIRTPYCAPNANAFAERFVRTVREEILDKILVINQAHLRRVLMEFLDYYNKRRPHQGLDQQSPIERPEPLTKGLIRKRQILGGIINDYFRVPLLNKAPQPA
jgi:hypothetical protein